MIEGEKAEKRGKKDLKIKNQIILGLFSFFLLVFS
jgi:hypothetical protein